jgi:hypothetical protein
MSDTATLAEQAKELGSMWKSLSDDEKDEWKAKAEAMDVKEAAKAEKEARELSAAAASPTAESDDDDDDSGEDDEDE